MKKKCRRIVLKLSGEAFKGRYNYGIDPEECVRIAKEIKVAFNKNVEIAVVIGGGNVFRGFDSSKEFKMERSVADYMGMLATVLNGLALQDALEKQKITTRVLTAIQMHQVAEPYIRRRAIRHLEKGRVVIFVGGTGNPYFTTDTTAALRAMEIRAGILLKGTKVNGVYSSDPVKNKKARLFKSISYETVLRKKLRVLDSTAIALCMENRLPISVFNMQKKGNLEKVVSGKSIGTFIK